MASAWFEGIDELNTVAASLERAEERVGKDAAKVVRNSAEQVKRWGRSFVPVASGATRRSIDADFIGDGRNRTMQAVIGPTTRYAGFIEWGTARMAPSAYMGPALDRVAPEFVAALDRLTAEALDR